MRSFIGNADMRLVYDANPVIGSMLILMFVVSMIFVNINLFYAILISYMSDARQTQEMQQAKEWAKFTDKIGGVFYTIERVLQLQQRFRGFFPGLWSRMKTWEKERHALEKKRDELVAERERALMPHDDIDGLLGAASPGFGRRKKRQYRQEVNWDDDDEIPSDTESEPDLGPLRFKEQLEPKDHKHDWDDHDWHHGHMLEDNHHGHDNHGHHDNHDPMHAHGMGFGFGGSHENEEPVDRDEEAKELVLEATEHVVQTIKDRCKGARNLVVGEMGEARQVLQGIGNVLEVLGRRARSLEAQQEQILPPEVVARVKAQAEEEEEEYGW